MALVLAAASCAVVWAVALDHAGRVAVPDGVTAAGVPIGGLTREAARERIDERIVEEFTAPVRVKARDVELTLPARELVHVDVEAMLQEAYDSIWAHTLPERVYRRVARQPARADVELRSNVDTAALSRWVDGAASDIDTEPVDARQYVVRGGLRIRPSSPGAQVSRHEAVTLLRHALLQGAKSASLPVETLEPGVTEDDLGKAIVIRLGERRLHLYDGSRLVKTYRVAVGAEEYSTPRGEWRVVNKRYMPTWRNPGSAWAKDMPKSIPPGPGNPLGTRALDLSAPGIRIHGTSNDSSIGTAASHGCLRMHRWDIEDLFPRVSVGTPVFVVH